MSDPMEGEPLSAAEAGAGDGGAGTAESARAELEAKTRQAAEAQDRYLRTMADFDNFRRRVSREREDWRRQAQEDLLREILPALDNFDRALNSEGGGEGGFRAGVELIHREFLKALERVGVRPFIAVGEVFDPQRHEAVARVDRPDVPDHTVVNEVQRGYLIGDRVLRPARVVVAVESPRSEFPGADS